MRIKLPTASFIFSVPDNVEEESRLAFESKFNTESLDLSTVKGHTVLKTGTNSYDNQFFYWLNTEDFIKNAEYVPHSGMEGFFRVPGYKGVFGPTGLEYLVLASKKEDITDGDKSKLLSALFDKSILYHDFKNLVASTTVPPLFLEENLSDPDQRPDEVLQKALANASYNMSSEKGHLSHVITVSLDLYAIIRQSPLFSHVLDSNTTFEIVKGARKGLAPMGYLYGCLLYVNPYWDNGTLLVNPYVS